MDAHYDGVNIVDAKWPAHTWTAFKYALTELALWICARCVGHGPGAVQRSWRRQSSHLIPFQVSVVAGLDKVVAQWVVQIPLKSSRQRKRWAICSIRRTPRKHGRFRRED